MKTIVYLFQKNTCRKVLFLQVILIAVIVLGASSCKNKPSPGPVISNAALIQPDSINRVKDAQFLVKATEINLEEIQLGQLAQQKSTRMDIKQFGAMMVDDHTKAQSSLTALALKKLITIPTILDSAARSDYQKLNNLSGSAFDSHYSDMMVNGHTLAIDLFQKESIATGDTDIRQMATAILPALQNHLNYALSCQKECEQME